jgi:hypothetical protein
MCSNERSWGRLACSPENADHLTIIQTTDNQDETRDKILDGQNLNAPTSHPSERVASKRKRTNGERNGKAVVQFRAPKGRICFQVAPGSPPAYGISQRACLTILNIQYQTL